MIERAWIIGTVAVALLGSSASIARAGSVQITNVSAHFPPGPYSALSVDAADPLHVAVATESGVVSWTRTGGYFSHDSLAIAPRRFDAFAIRGGHRRNLSAARSKDKRAIRLFLYQLREGLPRPRFAHWMTIADPVTIATDIALPSGGGGKALIAGPGGVWVSDEGRSVWTRVYGGLAPMPRDYDTQGIAVAIDPSDNDHILAGTDKGLVVSYNGGHTFGPHLSDSVRDEYISRIVWDVNQPQLVFAVGFGLIFMSEDGGKTFEPALGEDAEINDLAVSEQAIYIATSKGVVVAGSEGNQRLLQDKNVVGLAERSDGTLLVATKEEFYLVTPDGESELVLRTIPTDPFMKVRSHGEHIWILSHQSVLHAGPRIPTARAPTPPRIRVTGIELESAILRRFGLTDTQSTRLYNRWWAKLLPRVVFEANNSLQLHAQTKFDGTFPIRFREARGTSESEIKYAVMAFWDLTEVVMGDHNTSNPYAFLESNARMAREDVIKQARWRYRECMQLAQQLRQIPDDPVVAYTWRSRLEEHVAYLEYMSGLKLLEKKTEKKQ